MDRGFAQVNRVKSSGTEKVAPVREPRSGYPFSMRLLPLTNFFLLGAMAMMSPASEGGRAPHWAFQTVREPQVGDSIDTLIERGLAERALTPLGTAPPEVLLRRLHINITG